VTAPSHPDDAPASTDPSETMIAPACCPDEEWKALPGWPHEVSSCGRGRSVTRLDAAGRLRLGAPLPAHPDKRKGKGYLYWDLRDGRRHRKVHVAVAVLEAFTDGKPSPAHEAGHGNGVRTDNHWRNLSWVTKPQNRAMREEHRRSGAVTAPVTRNRANRGRKDCDLSQEVRFPRWRRFVTRHRSSVTSDRSHGTGSLRFHLLFSPVLPSVLMSLKSSLRSLRSLRPR